MGLGASKNKSEQDANMYLTQQFSGTCDVICEDVESGVSADIEHSLIIGGISNEQSCSTNASCLINSTMDSTIDVLFKVANSANAEAASQLPWFITGPQLDITENSSRQDMQLALNQSSNQQCDMTSYNEMDDISLTVSDSVIIGGINTSQSGSAEGQCVLNNTMQAAAYASGTAENTAKTGKDKKGEKMGALPGILKVLVYFIIGLVVIAAVGIAAFFLSRISKKKGKKTAPIQPTSQVGTSQGIPQFGEYNFDSSQYPSDMWAQSGMSGPSQKFTM